MEDGYVAGDFTLIGQLAYEVLADKALGSAGIQLYQGVDPPEQSMPILVRARCRHT